MGKCAIVIEGLEVNGTNEMTSCFYPFCGTGVKSAQTGKQAHSDLPKRGLWKYNDRIQIEYKWMMKLAKSSSG